MKFFEKIENWLQEKMVPVAAKLGNQKYLRALQKTFQTIIPIIMIGAFAYIISNPAVNYTRVEETTFGYGFFKAWALFMEAYGQPLKFLSNVTLGFLSLYIGLGIGYFMSQEYEMNPFLTTATVFIGELALLGNIDGGFSTDYFGGYGVLSSIVVAILVVELYRVTTKNNIGKITMPDTVPPALSVSLSSIAPMAISVLVPTLISAVLSIGFGTNFPRFVMSILTPLVSVTENPIGFIAIVILGQLAFFAGIHSDTVLDVIFPVLYANIAINTEAFAAGTAASELPKIMTHPFLMNFVMIGGSGATLGLCIALLFSKNKQSNTIGKISIVPALFGVNEPIIFGLPICFNPLMLIPFILAPVFNIVATYICMSTGLVNKAIYFMGAQAPVIFSQFLSTLDFRAVILFVVLVAVDTLIYLPFLKAYEKEQDLEVIKDNE